MIHFMERLAVSLTNHLSDAYPGFECDIVFTDTSVQSKGILPGTQYFLLLVCITSSQYVVPKIQGNVKPTGESISDSNTKENQWLSKVAATLNKDCLESDDRISWAAYHANL